MTDTRIEELSGFLLALGAEKPFTCILDFVKEERMLLGENRLYLPLQNDIVRSFAPGALHASIELSFTSFIESETQHRHNESDCVILVKTAFGQGPEKWQCGLNFRWHPLTDGYLMRIPRGRIHGLRRNGFSPLFAIAASYPPLRPGDTEFVKDDWER